MYYNWFIFVFFCSFNVFVSAADAWFFGNEEKKEKVAPIKPPEFICPVDVPVGYEVYVVLVNGAYIKRLGKWEKLTPSEKIEVQSFFERTGAVQGVFHQQSIVLLAFGISDPKIARRSNLHTCLEKTL